MFSVCMVCSCVTHGSTWAGKWTSVSPWRKAQGKAARASGRDAGGAGGGGGGGGGRGRGGASNLQRESTSTGGSRGLSKALSSGIWDSIDGFDEEEEEWFEAGAYTRPLFSST